ncbi:cytochrome P450 3A14-like [Dermacentor albipictus]|uniref:cytochrome P450 3A14-like n=1 Tax=Dermacentor albipictus TaxID=60249 RepID=UPI0038FC665D
MFVTVPLLICAASLLTALLIWRRRHFNYFKELGIPGPKPNLIWGNIREYHSMEIYKVIGKWLDKYGDVFGFFNGDVPFVVIRDLDFIEDVFVRNFQNFVNRGITMMTDQMHPIMGQSILHVGGYKWKNIRASASLSLTSKKLKMMMPRIQEDVGTFVQAMRQYADTGKEVQMLHKFEELSMDLTARGAFGINERFVGKPDHPFITTSKAVARNIMTGPFYYIGQCTTRFGALMKPLSWLSLIIGDYSFDPLNAQTMAVINLRKNNPSLRRPDILQNLLDVEYVEENENEDAGDKTAKGIVKSRALTNEEVLITASSLFIAGFETTATALSYMIYALAKHQDVQEKARREVIDAVGTNGELDYETLTKKLKYTRAVVDETLRLYSPGLSFITRQAKEDYVYNGVQFKAGTCFMVPQYQVQRDPRYWPNPLEFKPERYLSDNEAALKQTAYTAFGVGPRQCLGTRLALLEMRCVAGKILQKYRLELGPSQKGTMELGQYAMVSTPANGPWILLHSLTNENLAS